MLKGKEEREKMQTILRKAELSDLDKARKVGNVFEFIKDFVRLWNQGALHQGPILKNKPLLPMPCTFSALRIQKDHHRSPWCTDRHCFNGGHLQQKMGQAASRRRLEEKRGCSDC